MRLYFICPMLFAAAVSCNTPRFAEPYGNGSSVKAALCTECHEFPGSPYCQSTPTLINNAEVTQCSFCHAGSIRRDSTLKFVNNIYFYHDRMLPAENVPVTGTGHANGSVDNGFLQCTLCHDYPPLSPIHSGHVIGRNFKCFECHFNSVQSTAVLSHDPLDTSRSIVRYYQDWNFGLEGTMIPFAKHGAHMNKVADIVFRQRLEDSLNQGGAFDPKPYVWDRSIQTCSNRMACHSN